MRRHRSIRWRFFYLNRNTGTPDRAKIATEPNGSGGELPELVYWLAQMIRPIHNTSSVGIVFVS